MDSSASYRNSEGFNVHRSQVGRLLRRMDEEMASNQRVNGYIDQLQVLISNREDSELKGLAEKLAAVGRKDDVGPAERDLFFFETMLERLTHFESAQKLFFYFLARILDVFESKIMPSHFNLSRAEVEEIIKNEIIDPTIKEMDGAGGHDIIIITPIEVRGMINWLAERCHIRWQSC